MNALGITVHARATTLRILADKLEESVINDNMEDLIKMIQIVFKVASELIDISAGRTVQESRTHQN